jgi:hypothetical protein
MAEQIEFVGVFEIMKMTGIHNRLLEKRLGPPCALWRRGVKDNLLYRCERILDYKLRGRLSIPLGRPDVYYSLPEAARFVGITVGTLKKMLPKDPPAIAVGGSDTPYNLWPEIWLYGLRKTIGAGKIPVDARSLTRPKFGVRLLSPRHVLCEDQGRESKAVKRARPMDWLI